MTTARTNGPRQGWSKAEALGFIALGLWLRKKRKTLSWEVWRIQRTAARRAIVNLLILGLAEHLLRRRP